MRSRRNHPASGRSVGVTAIPSIRLCAINRPLRSDRAPIIKRSASIKILIASTPATGHLNPLLAITQILADEGHEIALVTGAAFRGRVEANGIKFFPLPEGADFDPNDVFSLVPELKAIPPGLEWLRVACERLFVDALPG